MVKAKYQLLMKLTRATQEYFNPSSRRSPDSGGGAPGGLLSSKRAIIRRMRLCPAGSSSGINLPSIGFSCPGKGIGTSSKCSNEENITLEAQ